jgi:hypothetical protein
VAVVGLFIPRLPAIVDSVQKFDGVEKIGGGGI